MLKWTKTRTEQPPKSHRSNSSPGVQTTIAVQESTKECATYLVGDNRRSKTQEQSKYLGRDNLTIMPEHVRVAWLEDQLEVYESEMKCFLTDQDVFVENLYKKLKQITRRWASWNHRSFGFVTSRRQLKELMTWECTNAAKITRLTPNKVNDKTANESLNPLQRYENLCQTSERLLDDFRTNIYKPLCEFFNLKSLNEDIKDTRRNLDKCLESWELQLNGNSIKESLFGGESERVVLINGLRNQSYEFDLVLRFIPDLLEKKKQVLKLARQWKNVVKSTEIKRRGTFTVSSSNKLLLKRVVNPVMISRRINTENVPVSPDDTGKEYANKLENNENVLGELKQAKLKCHQFQKEMTLYSLECKNLKLELSNTKSTCQNLEDKLFRLDMENKLDSKESFDSMEYNTTLRKELDSTKLRYCTQRIKLINSKKRVNTLNSELCLSQRQCQELEKKLNTTRENCNDLRHHLEISRKNEQTQENRIDALQNQCYALIQNIDTSNSVKKDLTEELHQYRVKCEMVENELEDSSARYRSFEQKMKEMEMRQKYLEDENKYLKSICPVKDNEIQSKKGCVLPDINKGRSS